MLCILQIVFPTLILHFSYRVLLGHFIFALIKTICTNWERRLAVSVCIRLRYRQFRFRSDLAFCQYRKGTCHNQNHRHLLFRFSAVQATVCVQACVPVCKVLFFRTFCLMKSCSQALTFHGALPQEAFPLLLPVLPFLSDGACHRKQGRRGKVRKFRQQDKLRGE